MRVYMNKGRIKMKLLTILKTKIQQLRHKPSDDYASQIAQANERLAKMERNYLIIILI